MPRYTKRFDAPKTRGTKAGRSQQDARQDDDLEEESNMSSGALTVEQTACRLAISRYLWVSITFATGWSNGTLLKMTATPVDPTRTPTDPTGFEPVGVPVLGQLAAGHLVLTAEVTGSPDAALARIDSTDDHITLPELESHV